MTVVNELELDDYLKGILPREVSFNWPMDSLKAQAVVSRTFALKNLKRHTSEGFNLCATVHCQVYGGRDAEKDETNRAVEDTHNEVLIYDDDLIGSFFHSNCGGRTETPGNVWTETFATPYLNQRTAGSARTGLITGGEESIPGADHPGAPGKFFHKITHQIH